MHLQLNKQSDQSDIFAQIQSRRAESVIAFESFFSLINRKAEKKL